jgi:hypothetical protein
MTPNRSVIVGLVAAAALIAPAPLLAQSLLNAGGLGIPIEPLDARSRALGGVAVGLAGGGLLPTDPAAAADLLVPSVTLTLANSWVEFTQGNASGESRGARFPALGVSYPVKTWGVATLTYGGVLDQRWQASIEHLLPIGASNARVTDRFLSDGGISALRLGFARRFASLSAGASVGVYTGELTRNLTRTFDSLEVGVDASPAQIGGFWNYSGVTATFGTALDLGNVVHLSGNVTWSGEVEADPSDDTSGSGATFDFPLELRVGGSAVVTAGLIATAGLTYADWTTAGEPLNEASGARSVMVGGGFEWTQSSLAGRRMPLRVGYRRGTLPFTFDAAEATESVWSAGLGIDFVQNADVTLAGMAVALERGSRTSGSLSESFLRASLTLRVSGF